MVGLPEFTGGEVKEAAPSEGLGTEGAGEVVGGDAAVASVAVAEWVDGDESVVESHGNFVNGEGFSVDPPGGVVDERAHGDCDLGWLDADVGLTRSVLAGPFPDLAEQRAMEVSEVLVVEQFFDTWRATEQCLRDVALLGVIELAPGRDIGRNESVLVLRR